MRAVDTPGLSYWSQVAASVELRLRAAQRGRVERTFAGEGRGWLQDGNRVDRRAGPATDLQWGHDEQELPPAALGAGVGQPVQTEVVEQVDAHADDRAHVDGER